METLHIELFAVRTALILHSQSEACSTVSPLLTIALDGLQNDRVNLLGYVGHVQLYGGFGPVGHETELLDLSTSALFD